MTDDTNDFEFSDTPLDLAEWVMAEADIGEPIDPDNEITARMLADRSGLTVRQAHNVLDKLHADAKLLRRTVRIDGRRCWAYRRNTA